MNLNADYDSFKNNEIKKGYFTWDKTKLSLNFSERENSSLYFLIIIFCIVLC